MLLLVGLGNPGERYADSRHNIGFMVLDHILAAMAATGWKRRFDGLLAECRSVDAQTLLLLKPGIFYNQSGRSVSQAARFYRLRPEQIIIFHDEIDLACGRIRVKRGGGHAGNNGMRSITEHLGPDTRRVRIGIGHPGHKDMVRSYVLSSFTGLERIVFERIIEAIASSLPFLLAGNDDRFQSEVMRLGREGVKNGL